MVTPIERLWEVLGGQLLTLTPVSWFGAQSELEERGGGSPVGGSASKGHSGDPRVLSSHPAPQASPP